MNWKAWILDFVLSLVLTVGATFAVIGVNPMAASKPISTSTVISIFVGLAVSAGHLLGRKAR